MFKIATKLPNVIHLFLYFRASRFQNLKSLIQFAYLVIQNWFLPVGEFIRKRKERFTFEWKVEIKLTVQGIKVPLDVFQPGVFITVDKLNPGQIAGNIAY